MKFLLISYINYADGNEVLESENFDFNKLHFNIFKIFFIIFVDKVAKIPRTHF